MKTAFTAGLLPRPSDRELAIELLQAQLAPLMSQARLLRDHGHGETFSYSREVLVPLTQLCGDLCHYCTFSQQPKNDQRAYLRINEVLEIARNGAAAHCREALFTLGDKPELRWQIAREALDRMGYGTTMDYLEACCSEVLTHTGLLPHINAGVMTRAEMIRLRDVSVSMGLMLECSAARLTQPGFAPCGSSDKDRALRLEMIEVAGQLAIPFTSGILIEIGETRAERIESLMALNDAHRRHGHLQEIIIQNFRGKLDTSMGNSLEPDIDELLWTVAAARLIFGAAMNIKAPPNLSPHDYRRLIDAGINDWGGIAPITGDHVNPETAWPQIAGLEDRTASKGKILAERLAIYPSWATDARRWVSPKILSTVLREIDADGWPRSGAWVSGAEPRTFDGRPRH